MNATRWIRIAVVAGAAAGFTSTVIANETDSSSRSDYSATVNGNPAAQLGPGGSTTPQRSGDSTAQHGSNNSSAQMGSGLNANSGAQLNNDPQATSAPPVDWDGNAPKQPVRGHTETNTGSKLPD
jgi:hypothetical protein